MDESCPLGFIGDPRRRASMFPGMRESHMESSSLEPAVEAGGPRAHRTTTCVCACGLHGCE